MYKIKFRTSFDNFITMVSLRAHPVNNKHDEGAAVSVQKRAACSNSIFWAKGLSTAEIHNEMKPV